MTTEQDFIQGQKVSREFYNLTEQDEKDLLKHFPDKKYFEFLYHAWHNGLTDDLDKQWDDWKPWQAWSYPIGDLIRYQKMLLDNRDLIKDAKVAVIGSHIGVEILFALNMGAKHCVGVEPVLGKNRLAMFVCEKAGFKNFEIITGELKQEEIYNDLQGYDTLILGGLVDMIPDHYRLIDNVSTTGIKNIIIEVGEKEHSQSDVPNITWKHFGEDEHSYGPYNPSVKSAIHGFPNLAFLKMLLGEFRYEFVKQDLYDHINSGRGEPKPRSVSLFRKMPVDVIGKDVNLKNE